MWLHTSPILAAGVALWAAVAGGQTPDAVPASARHGQLKAAAVAGDASAQARLGDLYRFGLDVSEHKDEALKWYRLAAEQGDPMGQAGLGAMYADGDGMPRDCVQAARWLRLAAEARHAAAQLRLGVLHVEGCGVKKDAAAAASWFRKAAEAGSADAQHYLGYMHYAGRGVAQDEREAVEWFRRAHANSLNAHATAYCYDSRTYTQAAGLPKDDVLASFWYGVDAAEKEQTSLQQWRDVIAAHLPAAPKAAAERLLVEWGSRSGRSLEDWVYLLATVPSDLEVEARTRLKEAGQAATAPLLAVLRTAGDPVLMREICELLQDLGPQEAVALREILSSRPPTRERIFIALALSRAGAEHAKAAVADLERGLRDLDRTVRIEAAIGLLDADPDPDSRVFETLAEGTCAGSDYHAAHVSYELSKRPRVAPGAASALVPLLTRPDAGCRTRVGVALAAADRTRARELIGPLRLALASDSSLLRLMAAGLLAALGPHAREAIPDLQKAVTTDPGLNDALARLTEPASRLDQCPAADLRLVGLMRDDAQKARAFVSCGESPVWEATPDARLLDGWIESIGADTLDVAGDSPPAAPPRRTLALFEHAAPGPLRVEARFQAPPIDLAFDGSIASFASLMAAAFGMNVVVEAGTDATVRVSARQTPWDGLVDSALRSAGLGYRIDHGTLVRIARRDRIESLRPLSVAPPSGAPISLHLHRFDMRDVMRLFQHEFLQLPIDLPPEPYEPLTLFANDVPVDRLFDLIVASRGWSHRHEGDRIRIEVSP